MKVLQASGTVSGKSFDVVGDSLQRPKGTYGIHGEIEQVCQRELPFGLIFVVFFLRQDLTVVGLELMILLPQAPGYWDFRLRHQKRGFYIVCFAFAVLGSSPGPGTC
jgi:hypothetical protein